MQPASSVLLGCALLLATCRGSAGESVSDEWEEPSAERHPAGSGRPGQRHWSELDSYYKQVRAAEPASPRSGGWQELLAQLQREDQADLVLARGQPAAAGARAAPDTPGRLGWLAQQLDAPEPEAGEEWPGAGADARAPSAELAAWLAELAKLQYRRLRRRAARQRALLAAWWQPGRLEDQDFCGPPNNASLASAAGAPDAFFPSHAGLYLAGEPHDGYLCAGTLVAWNWALTLASCVRGHEPAGLQVRLAEWAAPGTRPLSLPVLEVHPFRPEVPSPEHNLALVRLENVFAAESAPAAWPACPLPGRSWLADSPAPGTCWTPVRNLTKLLEFDPAGEGLYRERRLARLARRPVQLAGPAEQQCRARLLELELPQLLCSDYLSRARPPINRTELAGAGVYCLNQGLLTLVSMVQPSQPADPLRLGLLDLTFYRPWMRSVMEGAPRRPAGDEARR